MTNLRQRLDRLVPELDGEGVWERVLSDADRSRRTRVRLALPLVAVAAAVAVLALAWPFGSERPGGVLDRALAAIGEGPVLHVVYRGDWGVTYADLATGKVTPVVGESELWYDPNRGVHYVSRLGDKVVSDSLLSARRVTAWQEREFLALAQDYRSALERGSAKLIGPGRVGSRPVLWIRLKGRWDPSSDGGYHLFAQEIAIDRSSYEPVYARWTRDGQAPPGTGRTIAKLERTSADDADFEVDKPRTSPEGFMGGAEFGKPVGPARFDDVVQAPVWLGSSYRGHRLADAREFLVKRRANRNEPWTTTRGLYLFYGKLRRKGELPLRALSKPAVVLEEFRELPAFWISAPYGAAAREGSVLFAGRGSGLLLRAGTYVSIQAPSVRAVLGAAAALRPPDATAQPRSDVDFALMARQVEDHTIQGPEVSGGKRVRPRPIVRRRGRLVQTGSSKGISVRVYSGGILQFDLRAMDRTLRRVAPRTLSWHCLRLRRGRLEGGGYGGAIPTGGVKSVVPLGHLPRGRMVPVRPPFGACELGTGFGRNWLKRFEFHGMFEIPLTEAGRRYFEDRAAARELAYFVRSGARRTARRAMRAGEAAPRPERLQDASSPHITVTSSGDRFTVSLTSSTGRRFFVEVVRGRVHRTNVRRLADAYLN